MAHSKPSTTIFQSSYTLQFPWVKEHPNDKFSAMCTWCKTVINITSMGRTALKSHAKSAKHVLQESNRKKCLPIGMFFKTADNPVPGTSSSCAQQPPPLPPPAATDLQPIPAQQAPQPKNAIKSFVLAESVTKSEVFWCLEIVMNHIPFRVAARCAENFKVQFPDSDIAAKIQLQRTKIGYTVVFGLAPYFKENLEKDISNCPHLVVCFDESLNKVSQKQQMDLHIRFWDENKRQVGTRYLTSVFLGHSRAIDLLEGVKQCLTNETLKKVVQVSMDGPNVNFKMVSELQKELEVSPDRPTLLSIGSCGLHTVHNAFKSGMQATGWDVVGLLRSLYNLFKDSPARRSDYVHYSQSNTFPLKFCAVRWVESGNVANRALLILPFVKKYVDGVTNDKKEPTCQSYVVVKEKLKDKLLPAKICFFSSVCGILEPFLREFQNDAPMVPFVYTEMQSLVLSLFERVVKKDHLEKNKHQLHKIDLSKSDNLIFVKHLDLGFATKDALRSCEVSTDLEKLRLKEGARNALLSMIKKIMEKSPLKYSFTRSVTCLNPSVIQSDIHLAETRLTKCLEEVVGSRWVTGLKADIIKRQYRKLFSLPDVMELCKTYKRSKKRLDVFFVELFDLFGAEDYVELNSFIKFVLTLSHGNASVERGFSINKECIVENLKEESLVALRQVHDGVTSAGGLESFVITKDLVHSARNAHARYTENLKEQKEALANLEVKEKERKRALLERKKLEEEKSTVLAEARKRAAEIEERIEELKKKK